ncbi:LysR substrate-binding domain-containing protein [Salinimonas marina]|uniref:LysR substrate-binding domain-containing protein n=1 Tax=Salinimonas marina TaxID=2785918 RepID=UPI001E4125E0|nr:LysR substrate-binding domain-containing protein [Salinimonas marina]
MFAERYLFGLCKAFRQQHPGMIFDINCSYTTFNLHQQNIDLAFRATNTPPQDMVVHTLFTYRHVLVAAPDYLANHGTPVTATELLQHNCLLTQHLRTWPLGDDSIAVTGSLITNENHLLRQQALEGEGLFVLPVIMYKKISPRAA